MPRFDEEIEEYANMEITVKLNVEQYTILVGVLLQFLDEHPNDPNLEILKSIDFKRTR